GSPRVPRGSRPRHAPWAPFDGRISPTIVASRPRGRPASCYLSGHDRAEACQGGGTQGVVSGLVTLVSIIFLGFFLGMRHATDADHVIAVSTIVSREHK